MYFKIIFDFLEVYFDDNRIEINNFSVGTNYPKKNFEDMNSTVEAEVIAYKIIIIIIIIIIILLLFLF